MSTTAIVKFNRTPKSVRVARKEVYQRPRGLVEKKGAKLKLNESTMQDFAEAIRKGHHFVSAARFSGITMETARDWIKKGRAEFEQFTALSEGGNINAADVLTDYGRFYMELRKAMYECEEGSLKNIRSAGSKGMWQANAWMLERRQPDQWARPSDKAISTMEKETMVRQRRVLLVPKKSGTVEEWQQEIRQVEKQSVTMELPSEAQPLIDGSTGAGPVDEMVE